MKTIIASLIFAASAFAQSTFTLPATAGNEQALTVTISAAAIPNYIAAIATLPPSLSWPNSAGAIPLSSTLGSAITTSGQTSITLTSAANVQVCNGLVFTNALGTGLLPNTEIDLITGVSGNVLTVVRGAVGTTATTYPIGTTATITRVGGGTCLIKALIADGMTRILQSQLQGAALTAQTAAIAAANASIAATVAAAVQ